MGTLLHLWSMLLKCQWSQWCQKKMCMPDTNLQYGHPLIKHCSFLGINCLLELILDTWADLRLCWAQMSEGMFSHSASPLLSLHSLFSLSLGDDTKWPTRVDVSLNPNTIKAFVQFGGNVSCPQYYMYEGCSKWIAYCPLARYPRGAR